MSVLSYSFHSLLLKLPNKGMSFLFPPLKLSNKGMKEYSKIILFIPFHSIPSSQTRPNSHSTSLRLSIISISCYLLSPSQPIPSLPKPGGAAHRQAQPNSGATHWLEPLTDQCYPPMAPPSTDSTLLPPFGSLTKFIEIWLLNGGLGF